MKKLLFTGLLLVLFIACKEATVRYTTSSPEIDVTKALVKDYVDGNWQSWVSHYADTAKISHNSIESISPQQLQAVFQNDIPNYSNYNFSDENIFYEMIVDDKNETWVYFWGTWIATLKDTNQTFSIPVHIALKFVNNQIVEEYGYYSRTVIDAAIAENEALKNNITN